ncbi:uncharacterized protein LOC125893527 isoform X1 [Epinephelus fuscoguttatus]|uniref:uncharacterized protein LOC125893527 isoform X1 n=1 Tax=Epinephelus fuscoguttatus TaxID=293821 RepID=UPI0020D11B96|nr:uncharacterized protein LOC125893527 isoform X1 [Epinephelus fuscoguttatus]
MSDIKLQKFRGFLTERFTAVAVEIFGEFETIVEAYYEENKHLRNVLHMVLSPEIKIPKIDANHYTGAATDVTDPPPELNTRVDLGISEPLPKKPKEEQTEYDISWGSGQQQQGPGEVDNFIPPDCVKNDPKEEEEEAVDTSMPYIEDSFHIKVVESNPDSSATVSADEDEFSSTSDSDAGVTVVPRPSRNKESTSQTSEHHKHETKSANSLKDISDGESDGGEVIEGETDGGDTTVEMREEELDEGETDDPSFSPGEEESSEDEEPEPAFRKRPRPPVVQAPPASPSQSQQPSDVVKVSDQPDMCEGHATGNDGTVWKCIKPGLRTERAQSQSTLTEAAGPTAHARSNIDDYLSAFMCLVDHVMLQHICDCTVAEARRCGLDGWELSLAELKAFIALLLARGVHYGMNADVDDFWSNEWGLPFFSTTMSRNRYREIMRYLQFDRKDTRHTRLSGDKFALISEVWDRLIQNSIACYNPGAEITVDEQLFPTKSRCPFSRYMPNKPDKFGIKFWLAADVETKYMLNGFPYLGKDTTRPATQSPEESVVLKLMEPFVGKGRNVTTRCTSLSLAHKLLAKNTSLVGTINKDRRSLPPSVHQKAALHDTKVLQNDRATLTLYQGEDKKNVCILSTLHSSVEICDDAEKKPETVHYYNRTKVGVDMLDKMLRRYSARAATRRWPVAVFYNVLDIATLNAWVLYRRCVVANTTRRHFILELCKQLRSEHVSASRLSTRAHAAMSSPLPTIPEQRRRNCTVKRKCTKNKTTKTCMMCFRAVCGQCTVKVYSVCADCE